MRVPAVLIFWSDQFSQTLLHKDVLQSFTFNSLVLSVPSDSGGDGEEDGNMERTCDSLLMCIVTVLSHGLRSGGGVGDVLRKPSKEVHATVIRPCVCVCARVCVHCSEGVAPAAAAWVM